MSEPRAQTTDRQASHTPGPWSNERIWDTPASRIHARVEGIPVALAEVFSMRNVGEREANARLIAAAPELLEVVKRCTEAFGDFQKTFDKLGQPVLVAACAMVENVCKLVLDKAEGRS